MNLFIYITHACLNRSVGIFKACDSIQILGRWADLYELLVKLRYTHSAYTSIELLYFHKIMKL